MISRLRKLFVLLALLVLCSCDKSETLRKGIIGEFSIVYMTHERIDLLHNLTLNVIEFHEDGSLKLPGVVERNTYEKEDRTDVGTWSIHENGGKFFLNIATLNYYFNGRYEISFGVNEEKQVLQTLMANDKVTIGAEKFSFNTHQNQSFVDKLIKYTGGGK